MHHRASGYARALATAALVLGLLLGSVSTASAVSLKRTWNASYGSHGTAQMLAYTDGTGTMTIRLAASGASRWWSPMVRAGSCSAPGARIAGLHSIKTDAGGATDVTVKFSPSRVNAVWSSTWRYNTFNLRVTSGSSSRCANFTFVRATRVIVSGVGIDLPVVPGPLGPPLCNVAMYYRMLAEPQEPGVTMIFAHARKKMFLPLLTASTIHNGASLIGRTVYVYTSDSKRYTYRITKVLRHQRSIDRAFDILSRQLWLQTSEGPYASSTKLVVVAAPVGDPIAAAYTSSHPTPHPLHCAV